MPYATGNVDTEGGGGSQGFGSFDIEPYHSPETTGFEALPGYNPNIGDQMQAYSQLGTQLIQQQMAMMAQMQSMMKQQAGGGGGGDMGPMQFGSGNLTAGYDPNWLMSQVNAGSAQGQAIGGGGGGGGMGGGGKKKFMSSNEFAGYGGGEAMGWAGGGAL